MTEKVLSTSNHKNYKSLKSRITGKFLISVLIYFISLKLNTFRRKNIKVLI